jgi:hypothetical protein
VMRLGSAARVRARHGSSRKRAGSMRCRCFMRRSYGRAAHL